MVDEIGEAEAVPVRIGEAEPLPRQRPLQSKLRQLSAHVTHPGGTTYIKVHAIALRIHYFGNTDLRNFDTTGQAWATNQN